MKETKPPTPTPSIEALNATLTETVASLRTLLGPRCAVLMAVGLPISEDEGHDRFSAVVSGPCLMSRGLIAWAERELTEQVDAKDSSRRSRNPSGRWSYVGTQGGSVTFGGIHTGHGGGSGSPGGVR